jgi:hypothetical protein
MLHKKLKILLDSNKCNNQPIKLELSYDELAHLYSIEKGYQTYINTLDNELNLALEKCE